MLYFVATGARYEFEHINEGRGKDFKIILLMELYIGIDNNT